MRTLITAVMLSTALSGQVAGDCKRCPLELERSAVYCSEAAGCSSCRGSLVLSGAAKRRAQVRAWLAHRRSAVLGSRDAMFCRSKNVELTFAPGRLAGGGTSDRHLQMHALVGRIESTRARFLEVLGLEESELARPASSKGTVGGGGDPERIPASTRLHLHVVRDESHHRRLARTVTGLVHQGAGCKRYGRRMEHAVLQSRHLAGVTSLHRHAVFHTVQLLLSAVEPVGWMGERGLGWVEIGIAHYFESLLVDGRCSSFSYLERGQRPLRFRSGAWTAVQELPPLNRILQRDSSWFTPEQHQHAFLFVKYLVEKHGGEKLGDLVQDLKRGRLVASALRTATGLDLAALDRALRRRLGVRVRDEQVTVKLQAWRHFEIYLYTRSAEVRPRHRAVVRKAILQRARSLECGWRRDKDRKPILDLGPTTRAAHWKDTDRLIKEIWAAWPFAAVVEFQPGASVWIDWFRRRRGTRDVAGWFLDPAGTYVDHMNAAVVCDRDERFAYAAVVDTPTGDVPKSNEFCVRARIDWGGGERSAKGWWVRFRTSGNAEGWVEEMEPLVPWRVFRKDRRRGVVATVPVTSIGTELAVWGTDVVFRLPKVPDGVRACR